METAKIDRFQARYHLPPSRFGEKERLDHLLDKVLNSSLALALDCLGIPAHEEVCIRRIEVPIRIKTASADSELVAAWSTALADQFQTVLSANDLSNVIRYPSRLHGLFDFAHNVAKGDLQQAWAWKQLGFAVNPKTDSLSEAREGLVRSLLQEAVSIIPVLLHLTRSGRMDNILQQVPVIWWQDLAKAAVTEYGVEYEEVIQGMQGRNRNYNEKETIASISNIERLASRILRASSLASVIKQGPACFIDQPELVTIWSVFVILETEPALFRTEEGQTAVLRTAVEELLNETFARRAGDGRPKNVLGESERKPTSAASGNRQDERTTFSSEAATKPIPREQDWDIQRIEEPGGSPPLQRSCGDSEYGGLLFLLPLLEQAGIIDELIKAEQFEKRSLRWFLHALALELLPMQANDPAALAFCGLGPEDPLPDREEPGPDATEKRMLADWRLRILQTLARRMSDNSENEGRGQEKHAEQILHRVCCRNARIIADPGWIEVMFSLRDVSIEVRRAGLDLDPGFIPWLGVVIKFYYE
ncbi:MAG: hypothetical protein QTN59_04235 [Candidatus Electrothrix communis]|nr:MAG: hypothetical protein QTN59_04235 [Candidatus Electrothrix communis]